MTALSSPARRSLAVLLGAAVFVCLVAAGAARAQEPGVSLNCLGGARLSDGDLARGTTIIVVWASWSPRSRGIVERVSPLAGRWGGQARVVTVNFQEDRQAVEAFLAGKNLGAPVCLAADGAFSRKYNVATLPGLLIVKDGQVAYRGKLPDDADGVIAGLLR